MSHRERTPRGSLTPLITPFKDGEVDEGVFADLLERQIDGGSHGVTVCGTTGEPASLSMRERARLVELAVTAAGDRVPVLAGTGTNELTTTLELTRAAEAAGAAAALVVTPYYVKPSQAGLEDWFVRVAGATTLPVIIYDIPGRSAVSVAAETIARIAERAPNVVGVKEARADLEHVSNVLDLCGRDFAVYCGVESLCFPMLALGGAGHVSATANVLPREVAELADAAFAGDWSRARELHYRLLALNKAIFLDTNPVPLKAMLAALGLAGAEVRPPLVPLADAAAARLHDILSQYTSHPLAV